MPIAGKNSRETVEKQETENLVKLRISGANKETETRGKTEKEQRKNRERTEKEQRRAVHLLADYQPPNQTNRTPKKTKETTLRARGRNLLAKVDILIRRSKDERREKAAKH